MSAPGASAGGGSDRVGVRTWRTALLGLRLVAMTQGLVAILEHHFAPPGTSRHQAGAP